MSARAREPVPQRGDALSTRLRAVGDRRLPPQPSLTAFASWPLRTRSRTNQPATLPAHGFNCLRGLDGRIARSYLFDALSDAGSEPEALRELKIPPVHRTLRLRIRYADFGDKPLQLRL